MTSNVLQNRAVDRTRKTTVMALLFLGICLFANMIQSAAGQTTSITSPPPDSWFNRGDSVSISGVRNPAEGGQKVGVVVTDPGGNPVYAREVTTQSDGSWATTYKIASDAPVGLYTITATPAGGTPSTRQFHVKVEVTATTTVVVTSFETATSTSVQTVSGDTTLQTLLTVLSVTTVTTPTTITSLLPSYTTSTTTVSVAESTITASTEVTEMSAGTYVTVTQIVIIVGQTKSYIVETLTTSSTEATTSTILVPGTTETHQTTVGQISYVVETTKVVNYLLVALAFATPALLFGWALIIFRRRL